MDRVPQAVRAQVSEAIGAIDVKPERGAARRIRAQFIGGLRLNGWSDEVTVSRGSDMSITSMKDDVGLCLQTGNMARMYADLIKLQTLYFDNAVSSAVIVLPSQPMALALGDNIGVG